MKLHEYCELLPMMSDEELQILADDIKANGQQQSVKKLGGAVLDGKNRVAACKLIRTAPWYEDLPDDTDALQYVSSSENRRHLTTSQRAMFAAKIANLKSGQHSTIGGTPNGGTPTVTQEEAAEAMQVGTRTVQRAKEVIDSGDEELIEKVSSGEIPVAAAAKQVKDKSMLCKNCARKGVMKDCPACMEVAKNAASKKKSPKKKHTIKSDNLTDSAGNIVPDNLRDLFGDPWLEDLLTDIRERIAALKNAKIAVGLKNKGTAYNQYLRVSDGLKHLEAAIASLELLEETVASGLPHSVCQLCAGVGCNKPTAGEGCGCRNSGWMPAWRLKEHKGESA